VRTTLSAKVDPRRWQLMALSAWRNGNKKGVVQVVTGAGKTIFAELCMEEVAREIPSARFVIVVPTHALLDQWYVSVQEDFGLVEADIALFSGKSTAKEPRYVNLMVINTARHVAPALVERHPCMLIVDECHRAGSPANASSLSGPHIATLGMSATPDREYDDGFRDHVIPILGPIVYRYGLNEASRDGIVSPFELVNVAVDLLDDERAEYQKLTRRIAQYAAKAADGPSKVPMGLEALLRRRARVAALASMRVPVAVHLMESHRGVRAMIFHEDIKDAERLTRLLVQRGHSATIYHSGISPSVRRDNLRLYRRGVFDVLVSCRALDEGINVPETCVAIIASATASTRQRVQRLGRVLRPAPGKDSAVIYTLYATESEEQRLLREAQQLTVVKAVTWQRSAILRGETTSR
jgi:superfamily II DNA or RNA helicase